MDATDDGVGDDARVTADDATDAVGDITDDAPDGVGDIAEDATDGVCIDAGDATSTADDATAGDAIADDTSATLSTTLVSRSADVDALLVLKFAMWCVFFPILHYGCTAGGESS